MGGTHTDLGGAAAKPPISATEYDVTMGRFPHIARSAGEGIKLVFLYTASWLKGKK